MRHLARLIALLLALSGTTFIALGATSAPAHAKDMDCGQFSSQAAAQNYFLDHGGPNSDPDGLDADGDGIACETNGCPCNYGTSGGGGGTPGGGSSTSGPKPLHNIKVRGQEIRNTGRFEALGTITTFRNGRFVLQRKTGASAFEPWKNVRTKPGGAFRTVIKPAGQKRTCFRVVVPETKTHRKTTGKNFGCISAG